MDLPVENVIGLVFIGLLAIGLGVALSSGASEAENRTPHSLTELHSIMQLAGYSDWEVGIMRRSGYGHSGWSVSGSSHDALNMGISKLRQARIDTVSIVTNGPNRFEVRAYYESAGRRRTGKYVGGFVITPRG